MLGKQSDSEIQLKCTEQAIPEFPNLLFGTQIDTGISYFDATSYIQKTAPDKSVNNFFVEYKHLIARLCNSYDIKNDDVCKINEQGHYLIDGNFSYLFISFVEPNFLAYIFDRIHDLFSNGIVVSDSYIAQMAKKRLSQEVLLEIAKDEKTTEGN